LAGFTAIVGSLSWLVSPLSDLGMMLTSRTAGAAAFLELFFDVFLDAFAPDFFPAELDAFLLCFFAGIFTRLREVECDDDQRSKAISFLSR
jgi:hypothetical protein